MAGYIKSECFDAKTIIAKLRSVHYTNLTNALRTDANSNVTTGVYYEMPVGTYNGKFTYEYKNRYKSA